MSRLPAAEDFVKLYTDGACSGNPGPGGWAFILEHPASGKVLERFGAEPHTTNNRMEIESALRGLEILKRPCRVELVTDSQYLAKGINEWLPGWRANGYRRREGGKLKPLINDDLWRAVDALLAKHQVRVVHVRGHAGHPQNERCDQLAVAAYKSLGRRSAAASQSGARPVPRPAITEPGLDFERTAPAPVEQVHEPVTPPERSEPSLEIAAARPLSEPVPSRVIAPKPSPDTAMPNETPATSASPKAAKPARKPRAKRPVEAEASTIAPAAPVETPRRAEPAAKAESRADQADSPVSEVPKTSKSSARAKPRTTTKKPPAKKPGKSVAREAESEPREPARWDPDEFDA